MKKRPLSLIIAALVMAVALLAGYSLTAFFPQLAFSGGPARLANSANGGNFQAGGPPPDGGLPPDGGAAPSGGNTASGGSTGSANVCGGGASGTRPARGPDGGGPGGGFAGAGSPLGTVTSTNTTSNIALIGLQTGLKVLNILFVGLGLVAAFGLLRMKRWGLVMTIVLFAMALVGFIVPQNSLTRLLLPLLGITTRTTGSAFTLASLFSSFRFNWVSLIEPVGLLAAVVLALLPVSRKAMAPVSIDDIPDEGFEEEPLPAV